jgi:acyl-CoA dehydrogenase
VENIPGFGMLLGNAGLAAAASALVIFVIGYLGSPLIVWLLAAIAILIGFGAPVLLVGIVVAIGLVFLVPPIRRSLVSSVVMKILKGVMPNISATERTALEAGVVWVEADLFSGKPDFKKIINEPYPQLTAEEKAFMDNQVNHLCSLVDSWKIWKTREFDQAIWDYMKKEGFFGMIVPKEYGGLGFSAMAHSEVIMKIASRNIPACVTVMVPNSLGPAELLIHYGTEAQKKHYLPRLARGEDIPCFGLTEPTAGSDAGSITSTGEVFKGEDGKLYIKLNWNKRWITLAAISTVVGLAFRLRDPKNLLGKGEDVGITCALIPSSTPGVVIGRRHDPLAICFYNCPTQGKDVIVPIDAIIGGTDGAGIGWSMLMDCLAAGRGISLPAQAVGSSKVALRAVSAHSVIRQQFGVSIGKFEGVEEPLARMAAITYALEGMRRFTLGALDKGIKPPVITAMQKYYSTELGRKVIVDAMDVMGGAGISMGPRNLLAELYIGTPIGITVEGANILTRTLIVFGQGALRAHPYAFKEVNAIEKGDLKGFDEAFWGHVGHIVRNTFRAVGLSLTRGYLAGSPVGGKVARYYRRLAWTSATFAIMADIAMGALGGSLKFREKITGRFADIMAWMYIITSTLRRFEADGRKPEDIVYVHFACKMGFVEIQKAFDGIFDNLFDGFPIPGPNWLFKEIIGLWSRFNSIGSQSADGLGQRVVKTILVTGDQRDRLTDGIYYPKDRYTQQLARLDYAMDIALKAEATEKKIRDAVKKKQLPKKKALELVNEAQAAGIISAEEAALMKEAGAVRLDAIQVDDFSQAEFVKNGV